MAFVFISFSVKCEDIWHHCFILLNFNSYNMCGWKRTLQYAYSVTHTDSFIAIYYTNMKYMLPNTLRSYLKCCFYLHIIKVKCWKQPPEASNKTLDLVPCVQIKVEILHCVKATVRLWQAAVYCIVWFLPPSRLQHWSSLNRLKCYRGSHHKIQPACSVNIISANVRNHKAQETYVGSDSNKSSVSVKYQSKLSMRASVHSLYVSCAAICKARLNALSLSPVNLPQSLTEEKRDVSGLKGETHINDIVNARLHSVKNVNPL